MTSQIYKALMDDGQNIYYGVFAVWRSRQNQYHFEVLLWLWREKHLLDTLSTYQGNQAIAMSSRNKLNIFNATYNASK